MKVKIKKSDLYDYFMQTAFSNAPLEIVFDAEPVEPIPTEEKCCQHWGENSNDINVCLCSERCHSKAPKEIEISAWCDFNKHKNCISIMKNVLPEEACGCSCYLKAPSVDLPKDIPRNVCHTCIEEACELRNILCPCFCHNVHMAACKKDRDHEGLCHDCEIHNLSKEIEELGDMAQKLGEGKYLFAILDIKDKLNELIKAFNSLTK